jgi:molybdopterin-guanine dinucleotide biosynthesis protein A
MMPMFDVQGFILVGGASSRMGQDKARLKFGDFTAVDLVADALHGVTDFVTTVGRLEANDSDLPNIPDLRRAWGPLAGIEAALRHATSSYSLIVGCDFPFVTAKLFERLMQSTEDADAVVPLQNDGRPQPLCAVYRVETCLPATEHALAGNEHSPRAVLDKVRTCHLPFSEISHLEGAEHFFFNVNTPENYRRAQEIFQQVQPQHEEA